MKLASIAVLALLGCASVAWAKPHVAANTNVIVVSGATACPAGTTEVHSGASLIFKNTNNGNLTEDTRCWETPPSTSVDAVVVILGPCVVCRFGP